METVTEFLSKLSSSGVKLSVEAGQLSCYAQKGTLTSDLKAGILKHKPELIALLESVSAKQPVAVARGPREFPLSAGQKGLYILDKLNPGSSAYNVPLCFRIDSVVDAERMAEAWALVLDQFPILSARIIENEGAPHHLIDDACRTTVQQRALDTADDEELLAFLRREVKAPFDLNRGPLTRVSLFTLPNGSSILLLNIHHIIFDGVSAVTLQRALLSFYEQLCAGRPVTLAQDLPGYHEFVAAEEAMLASPQGAAHARFWQKQLDGELPTIELLPDWRRPSAPVLEGETLAEELPEDVARLVAECSKAQSVLPSVLFLGVFQLLLHEYTNEDDVIVGMPVMGRADRRFETDLGYFINMVPLRAQCGEDIRMIDFLRKAQGTMLDALYHSAYPFPLMVDRLESRQWDRNPVFQVSFAYQNYVKGGDFASLLRERTLDLEYLPGIYQEGDSDFGVEIFEAEAAAFGVHLQYNPALYSRETIRGVFERYCALLRAVAENPNRLLHEYSVVTGPEKQKLLVDFNETRADYPAGKTIHQLFAERAALAPDSTAVISGDGQLTYGELLRKSQAVALYLQSQGAQPDELIGLCMERSLDLVTALLGILQSGAAYVPLDASYPDDRIAYMLRDSRAAVVLTQESLREKLAGLVPEGTRLLTLAEIANEVPDRGSNAAALLPAAQPHNLAYVIYTSGSTGQPKGVMVPHRGLVNHATYFANRLGLSSNDRVLQFASLSFDTAAEEMFPTWLSGACLVLRADGPSPAPADFFRVVETAGVTVLDLPTAYWHELADYVGGVKGRRVPSCIRAVILGGESASAERYEKWRRVAGDTLLLNTYGPTEATIIATAYEPGAADGACVGLPIGRPIANAYTYVLDEEQQLVPVGVAGELYIGGAGVARGYLNRPDLTAERFLADPFRGESDARVYRTGDRVRYRRDGVLEFLGRADDQVKIRGFRIEPGEIETALRQHAAVRDAVVLVREDRPGDRQLIAYVVSQDGAPVPAAELRTALKASLPDFMIPAAFVAIEKIPMLPNGKLDRRSLARLDFTVESSEAYLAPRSEAEARLVAIWSEVLNMAAERIGINDSFFELGGHSLLATRVISKIRTELDVELPLKALFERNTVAQLAELIATANRRDIPAIVPADRNAIARLPLSYAQERLWFINQLEPDNAGYNVPGAVLLRGDVDADQLETAFNAIIARHETLRTVFPSEGGRARQVILDRVEFQLERIDLTQDENRDAKAREICRHDAAAPFDLEHGPLLRGKVIKLAADEHILLVNMHHIVSDGWSLGIFVREFGAILEGGELPALPIQYADYAVWQRNWLEEGGVLEAQLGYWRQKLAGAPESLDLATDFARPNVQSFAGARRAFTVDARLTAELKRLAEQQGGTLYMVLVAAVKALLHRYTGQNDICVGSPIANRQYAETEGLIGMFVNTLALRDDVVGEEPFAALLAKVKATCLEAYEHQDAPFEKVVDAVRPQRNMAVSPLFQVMVVLQNAGTEANDAAIELYPLEIAVSKFDLTVELTETAEGLDGVIEYSTALFKPETVARMIDHLAALCRAITAAPAARVCDLDYLNADEEHQLLVDFNDTQADYPKDKCIHEFFAEQVAIGPDRTAAVYGDRSLTYAQLQAQCLDLGLYLQSLGVQSDDIVGLCLERSLEMMIAIMGTVQAGGAYMPLDPDYPDDRLEYMVADSRARVVLTQSKFESRMRALAPDATIVLLDRGWPQTGGELRRDVTSTNLCYVIYTSGSTGRPKGVLNEHRALVNRINWMQKAYRLDATDVVLQKTPYSFDVSVWEFFWPMMVGATVVFAQPDGHKDVQYLQGLIDEKQVTTLHFVPSMLRAYLDNASGACGSVKRIFASGEALDKPSTDRYTESFPNAVLHNLYGPTEAAIDVTSFDCSNVPYPFVPIGAPIDNIQLYVLDQCNHPQPIGVPGELHIAGDGLARGYLNRPELTAEKFVANPFTPGTRMYKTGDLARWLDDGNIQYLGRIDTQVKIRGFRVELGEIEAALNQHPSIQDSAVIARNQQLVAFYAGAQVSSDELRAQLARTLPEYMVPSAFVKIDAIPLSSNGKVDRRALSRIDVTMASGREYVAPRSETETKLVAIWAQVLNVAPEKIGVNDNFFELGGHSLLATQLVSRVRADLGVELPLKSVFEETTVARFAALVAGATQSDVPAIVPVDRATLEFLPLSFAQERLWFINQLEPDSAGYNVPGAVRIEGDLNVDLLDEAFNRIIARHETLRTVFHSEEGQARQVILDRLDFELERVDLMNEDAAEAKAEELCRIDALTPFDLANGPLIRGKAIRLSEREHVLMLNLHHIISDGWSVGVLFRELAAIMDALRSGREPELPALPVQYADYSVWQRNRLEGEGVLDEQLAYWQSKLAGVPESLDMPFDRPRPGTPEFAGATHTFALDAELTARIRRTAEQQGGTLYMVLLAAFKTLLHRYTGQEDLCIGCPIANRQYAETEGLIGMFVNTLALRTRVSGDESFADLLASVKATCLEAYEHQDAPFERVVDALRLERNLTVSPLFQIMVVLQNAERGFDPSMQLFGSSSAISKFDLTLELTETADGLAGAIHYRTALYNPETIARMASHLAAVCDAVTSTPASKISEVEYLDVTETRRLLVDFNDTRSADPNVGKCMHEVFAEVAAAHPERIAVVCATHELTYAQLRDRSRALAAYLRAHGVTAGSRVGLCTDRSLEMVVGMLGIIEAGGAYVPLDPAYPADRLQYMVEDAAPALVLTQEQLKANLPATTVPVVALDSEWDAIEHSAARSEAAQITPDDLAYVIYTSGSTGTPKGVMVRHGGVVNLRHALEQSVYEGREGWERVSVNASFSFDSSVKQFVQLLSGRTLVMVPQDVRLDADALLAFIGQQQIDVFDCTPSQLVALLNAGMFDGVRRAPKAFLVGGEAISSALWRSLAEHPEAAFFNVYGPAECTVDATVARITAGQPEPHIGAPIANVQVYILDRHGRPVPAGVVGEICIGGAGVARGYLGREELTAEKFIADPWTPGARIYKTGDLGRWRADGTIAYVGRNDHQVKLRGQRIELGEIETQLASHPGVREAVVIAREDVPGDKRLVAYVTVTENAIGAEELRAYLLARLPNYMVPAAFVELDALPLTPNKKVDRNALPQPDALAYARKDYEPPQGETETILTAIWQELLRVERVGRHDNFFELGGHSLLATQVMSKIRGRLNADLPLKALFERSSVAGLAELIATAKTNDIPPIEPVDRTQLERLPLSFAQERLWFIDQLEPGSAGYNVASAVVLRGAVDADLLEQAFNAIIDRHENLRTVFPSHEGRAEQRVLDHIDWKLERVDLSRDADRDAKARELCLADAATPFDLATGPLMRGRIVRLAEDEHVLFLNMHHIISDGWSHGVLLRELGLIAEALREGRTPELPALPVQYADYAVWQRTRLEEDGVLAGQLAYWQQKLAGVPESLDLATDFPRPSVQSFAGATQEFALDAQLTASLKRLAEQQGGTLYMVLLAAVKALLHRYTGQNDICVGSPIANRQYGETEGLIGMFVNTLALRDEVRGDESFAALLAKVKATCLEAYEHQDAPFEKVVDAARPQRNMAISPLFQVMVILQNAAAGALDASIELYPLETGISKFDLTLEFTETADGLAGALEYSTALYKPQTIARMVEHLTALFRAITATPAAKLHELQYLGHAERHTLLTTFNDTRADYPQDTCIHELFEEQVAANPNKTAAIFGAQSLTYAELDEQTTELAICLQTLGIEPDHIVGLCLERSLEMMIGIMGTVRAGAAYMPLDPDYPDDRLQYMVADSRATVVLTQEKFRERIAVLAPEATIILLDRGWPKVSGVELRRDVRPNNLCYVIYTSGSTGRPKGVLNEHRALVNRINWMQKAYQLDPSDVVLQKTPYSFDVSVWEFFWPMMIGATVVFAQPDGHKDVQYLQALIEERQVTTLHFVPSMLRAYLDTASAACGSVKRIFASGEALDKPSTDRYTESFPGAVLHNLYGPTEAAIDVTSFDCSNVPYPFVPIGKPIDNIQLYVLDQCNHPQPIGVPGELHIAGDGLARGYLNRPELTEEKFVANPFTAGARMYKTGDLARWLDDGNIQYLGRIDTQVKIRGFRVELGEIEAALNQHPSIQDSAVIARNQQLVAFYAGTEVGSDDLRAMLSRTLPEYMVPPAFVKIDAIPLSSNGKVDRRALSRIDVTMSSAREYVAPRSETETQLVAIWAQVLNLAPENVGVDDNFFELGGHSLLAVQLMAKIERRFAKLLPLATLFAAPTVAALAKLLANDSAPAIGIVVPMQTGGDAAPVFAVPGAGGNVLALRSLSTTLGANQPFYALQAVGLDGRSAPLATVEETAQANIAALKSVQPNGPYRLVGHSYGGVVAYEMARLLLENGDDVASLVLLDSVAPSVWQESFGQASGSELEEASKAIAELYGVDLNDVDVSAEQFTSFFGVYQANLRCYRAYKPQALLRELDVRLYIAASADRGGVTLPHDHGWSQLVSAPVRIHHVEAGHYSILDHIRF